MAGDEQPILVTGGIGSGKSRLLARLLGTMRGRWRATGFIAAGQERLNGPFRAAETYQLELIDRRGTMPWARRRADTLGYDFNRESGRKAEAAVRSDLESGAAEICLLDEIGLLEVGGKGFAGLFRHALDRPGIITIAAVKKKALQQVIDGFGIDSPLIVDLDQIDAEKALHQIRRRIEARDDERIGVFAGVGGLVEVGLGSTLNAYRVPFKGHALCYLQNLLLVTFGKRLAGRGLIRIAFISAMLKAFSPLGNPIRPMVHIFFQGCAMALPIRLLGWNLPAVLLGSMMMAWFTLAAGLTVDYLTFGPAIFAALSGVITRLSVRLGTEPWSVTQVLAAIFALKALVACGVGSLAYYGEMQPLIGRLSRSRAIRWIAPRSGSKREGEPDGLRAAARSALGDVLRPRFLLVLFISILFLLFFAGLSRYDLLAVAVRALCISYLSFLAARRVDVARVAAWLDRRADPGIGRSLPVALGVLGLGAAKAPRRTGKKP